MNLTTENYYSTEANREYMSCHQFASWVDCPSREAATQAGTYEAPFNKAFLIGSYVDAAITLGPEALAELVEANAENIVGKRGKYADFVKADEMIARLQRDEMAMRLLTGKPQEIVTGELGGVQWRGAIDVLLESGYLRGPENGAILRRRLDRDRDRRRVHKEPEVPVV